MDIDLLDIDFPAWIDQLIWLHVETSRLANSLANTPAPNSKASLELASFQDPGLVTTAYNDGDILTEVVADQLIAFAKTISEPMQTIAPYTCVRSLLEASAIGCWLLDPQIDVRTRVGRSLAFRFEGMTQREKYWRSTGDKQTTNVAASRIEQAEQRALKLGFPQFQKDGRISGIGQKMPSTTDLIRDVLHEDQTYRLLSAVAHAHPWALHQLSYRPIGTKQEVSPESSEQEVREYFTEKSISPTALAFLFFKTTLTFSRIVVYKFSLFGWDQSELHLALEKTCDFFIINRKLRFWINS